MKILKTQITINASPQKIWQVLKALNLYATWNPFIIYGNGQFEAGGKFSFILKAPGEKPKLFRSRFKKIEENSELRWLKRALFPGIFDTEHIITLQQTTSGETQLHYHQHFSGLLSRWFFNRLEYSYLAGMKKMNQALKELCEQEKGSE